MIESADCAAIGASEAPLAGGPELNGARKPPITYLIGRSTKADIVLRDATVSRLHAELVLGKDGTWYLTDRDSTSGTYLRDGGNWVPLKQAFVHPHDRLKLGNFECSFEELVRSIQGGGSTPAGSSGGIPRGAPPTVDDRPVGPVRRDPLTGEILSSEDDQR